MRITSTSIITREQVDAGMPVVVAFQSALLRLDGRMCSMNRSPNRLVITVTAEYDGEEPTE